MSIGCRANRPISAQDMRSCSGTQEGRLGNWQSNAVFVQATGRHAQRAGLSPQSVGTLASRRTCALGAPGCCGDCGQVSEPRGPGRGLLPERPAAMVAPAALRSASPISSLAERSAQQSFRLARSGPLFRTTAERLHVRGQFRAPHSRLSTSRAALLASLTSAQRRQRPAALSVQSVALRDLAADFKPRRAVSDLTRASNAKCSAQTLP